MKFSVWIVEKVNKITNCNGICRKILKHIDAFQIIVVSVGLILLLPLLQAGFYNHMSGDDWYNAKFAYAQIMSDKFSLTQLLNDMWRDLVDLYSRWSFTYTGYFFAYIMPAGFGEQYAFLHTVILLVGTVFVLYVFINSMLQKVFTIDRKNARSISVLLVMIMIQGLPSAFDAFYWWSGAINNVFGFWISLLMIKFLVEFGYFQKKVRVYHWLLITTGFFLIAGTSYAAVLVLLCSAFMILADVWYLGKVKKKDRLLYSITFIFFVICIIFAISAPGNGRRAEALQTTGYSFLETILRALAEGVRLIYQSINLYTISVWILILFLAFPCILKSGKKYKNPILVFVITYCIYSTSFMPTLYAQGIAGENRVRNIQYFYALIVITINTLYVMGWYCQYKGIKEVPSIMQRFKQEICLLGLLLTMIFVVKGETSSKAAYIDLTSGNLQQFHQELLERETLYHNNAGGDLTVEQLTVIPILFEGYTDIKEESYWINDNIKTYYKLAHLRAAENVE